MIFSEGAPVIITFPELVIMNDIDYIGILRRFKDSTPEGFIGLMKVELLFQITCCNYVYDMHFRFELLLGMSDIPYHIC